MIKIVNPDKEHFQMMVTNLRGELTVVMSSKVSDIFLDTESYLCKVSVCCESYLCKVSVCCESYLCKVSVCCESYLCKWI